MGRRFVPRLLRFTEQNNGLMGAKRLGIIGDPVEHSLSPALFEYVLATLGLRYRYEAFHVRPSELEAFVRKVREEGILGVNVTIPHKERIVPWLDRLDEAASGLSAVNTIANKEGRLIGYNTDVAGFLRPLRERGVDLQGVRGVVLGAGGAAKAAVHGLITLNIAHITLANRTRRRAETLATQIAARTGCHEFAVAGLDDPKLMAAISQARLLVNATSVGMRPHIDQSPLRDPSVLHKGLIVYDLVYTPLETRFLREARERGARTIDGLEMLIVQALESLPIWTGHDLSPFDFDELVGKTREHLVKKTLDARQATG